MENTQASDTPFFSVCIPVYNAQAYLRECVDSVLQQTEKSFEIILLDDGSRDQSGAICEAYGAEHPNVRPVHQKNSGPLVARHEAVKLARGQYLTFLDADDLYVPQMLQTLREAIEATGADAVIFDMERFYPDGKRERFPEPYPDGTVFARSGKAAFYRDFLTGSSLNSLCRKCLRRDLYDTEMDIRPYFGMRQGEDKLMSLHCMDRAEKILYLKNPLYRYRMQENSTTNNLALKNYQDVQLLHDRERCYLAAWQVDESARRGQYRRRRNMGCNVVAAVAARVNAGKADRETLAEAVAYIAGDPEFAAACGVKPISRYQKRLSRLIQAGDTKKICRYVRVWDFLRDIKRAIRR